VPCTSDLFPCLVCNLIRTIIFGALWNIWLFVKSLVSNLILLRPYLVPSTLFSRTGTVHWVQRFATGWTVRGSNPGEGETFRNRQERPCGPPSLLYNGYWILPGGKAVGAWRWPPTLSNAEFKEIAELYSHSPSGPSWSVPGWTLPLPLLSSDIFFSKNPPK
jgi:hypothetical protein